MENAFSEDALAPGVCAVAKTAPSKCDVDHTPKA